MLVCVCVRVRTCVCTCVYGCMCVCVCCVCALMPVSMQAYLSPCYSAVRMANISIGLQMTNGMATE